MATLSDGASSRPVLICKALMLACLAATMIGGCEAGPRAYRHGNLPAEYRASAAETAETVDISRLATSSVDSNLIDNGDLLEVSIITPVDESPVEPASFRVDEQGMVNVSPVGQVAVAGLLPEAAEAAIAMAGIQRQMYVIRPQVTVKIEEKKVNRVMVIGEVEEPGEVEVRCAGSTLLAVLVAAGGLTEEASLGVEIRRPAKRRPVPGAIGTGPSLGVPGVEQVSYEVATGGQATSETVHLLQAVNRADNGYHLNDGDVVYVGKQPPQLIHVVGLVNQPGEYEIKPGEKVTVMDALGKAGWKKLPIADKVTVYRRVEDQEDPIHIPLSLRDLQKNGEANILLMSGDVVSVDETVTTVAFDTLRTFFRVSLGSSLGNMDLFQ
jgi:polysaccharide export outer membrane protein